MTARHGQQYGGVVLEKMPFFLKAWIGLTIVGYVVTPIVDPSPLGYRPVRVLVDLAILGLLTFGMFRRSRIAWGVVILFAILSLLVGVAGLIWLAFQDPRPDIAWTMWALAFGAANIYVLLSADARDWFLNRPRPSPID